MKYHTKITQTLLLMSGALIVNTSHASDGFNIGSVLSNDTLSHTIERNTGTNTTPSISSTVEESDFGAGIKFGYQFHVTDDFFLGVEAFYQDQSIETRNLNNLLITELTLNKTYGLKIKGGVDVTDRFSVYGLIGQTTLDFDINNSYTFAPPMTTESGDIDEITIGIGAEFSLNDHWSFTAEYSQLNDVNFDPIPEVAVPGKINDNELDFSSLSFGLNYRF